MNRTNKKTISRRAWLGSAVFLAAIFVFFLTACDSSIKDTDSETAISAEDLSRSVIADSPRRVRGEGFSRRAEERGLSPEDFTHRHGRREYRHAGDETGRSMERGHHRHRFDEGSRDGNRREKRKITREG